MTQDALQAQLDRLRAKFAAELPQKLTEAEALLAALQGGDGEALTGLRFIVHRLNGTGGTMGFTALSQAAAALEARLEDCLKAGGAQPEDVAAIAAGLAAVKAAA
ncbi:Hpt domain-containing protein [Inquilinus sp.]|jgi:chemotaxis protein histidine kinase CheA|uniref:Hpt domain-containing protein n=1 Tax=Inquilinus sp. TaxID=1932117 RepID=UPI003783689A